MTKSLYKNIAIRLVNSALILGLIVPTAFSFAQTTTTSSSTDRVVKVGENFCLRAVEQLGKITKEVSDRAAKLQSERDNTNKQIEDLRADRDMKKAAQKTEQDKQFEDNLKKLEEKAGTDAEKQAILKYRVAVRAAIDARRAVLNVAIKAFRDGVDKIRTARKDAIKKAMDAFQSSVKTAQDKAKADCVAKVNPKTVRENLRKALKTARDKFETDRKAIEKRLDAMKPLIDARKAAFEKAQSDFRAALKNAKDAFKAARGSNGTGTSTATSS